MDKWNAWRRPRGRASLDADLSSADLIGANLIGANLHHADLSGADLRNASLCDADLITANLIGAKLGHADLSGASLRLAELNDADLSGAELHFATLTGADLSGADLSGASLLETIFGYVDLSAVIGLEVCKHLGPSIIDFRTLEKSKSLPLPFLRGVGLPDTLINYYLPAVRNQTIQYYSCFISYAAEDEDFAKRIHADLQSMGVRCWFAPHDMPIGGKILDQINVGIGAARQGAVDPVQPFDQERMGRG